MHLTFGQWLAIARENAGLTQKELAVKIGRSANTVNSWENQRSSPTLEIEETWRLCQALGVSFDELYKGKKEGDR